MEVHAHTHTARKKWTHYFWEFLMLFLAVFCGFLAEYQLEHKIEKDREKQFNPPLRTTNNELLQELSVFAVYMRGTKKGILGVAGELKIAGAELIEYLQKEYHLE